MTPLFYAEHQENTGVGGFNPSINTWNTVPLNTELVNEIFGATLSSNQITLPAGTYEIEVWAPLAYIQSCMIRLYNVTDSETELWGLSSTTGTTSDSNGWARLYGKIELQSSKTLEVQVNTDYGSGALGVPSSLGPHETYTWIKIRQIV
jgi:hypothetical protein